MVSYIETLLSIFFLNIWKNLKIQTIQSTKNKLINVKLNKNIYNIICVLFIIFILTTKSTKILILLPVIMTLIITKELVSSNQNHLLVMFSVVAFTPLLVYISNFVLLFIFLEFYSIIFYFYLLNYTKTNLISLIKYKNSLLLYLFNNFLISILFMFSLSHIIFLYGTTQFNELVLFNTNIHNEYLASLILSILIKLSLPGFHFLKIEMYKYLSLDNVIIFSVTTLFVNFLLINFLLNINLVVNIFNTFKFVCLLIVISIFIIIQKLKLSTFQEFIAYSGFATNNLILLNLIV